MRESRGSVAWKIVGWVVVTALLASGCRVAGTSALAVGNAPSRAMVEVIAPPDGELPIGNSVTLRTRVIGHDDEAVTWSSSDVSYATVAPDGVVTAVPGVRPGSIVYITATSVLDPTASDTVALAIVDGMAAATSSDASGSGGISVTPEARPPSVGPPSDESGEEVVSTPSSEEMAARAGTEITDLDGANSTAGAETPSRTDPSARTDGTPADATDEADDAGGSAEGSTEDEPLAQAPTPVQDDPEEGVEVEDENGAAAPTGDGAQVIFVDASAGPDGIGSEGAPFGTINAAVAAAPAGGTVRLAPGRYHESLLIEKVLTLEGAGDDTVLVGGPGMGERPGVVAVAGVDGVVLRDFRIVPDEPGPAAAALAVYDGADDLTVQNVSIDASVVPQIHGVNIVGGTGVTLRSVDVSTDQSEGGSGAGIRIAGASSNIVLSDVATSGHANYAGVVLEPQGQTIADIAIEGTFEESDPFTALLSDGGTLEDLDAPQFRYVIRNLHPGDGSGGFYGSGDWWFFRESEEEAIRDALFDFGRDTLFEDRAQALGFEPGGENPQANGAGSVVHVLSSDDQADLGDEIVVGRAAGAAYGYSSARSGNVQVAFDQAGALTGVTTVRLREGTFRGHEGPISIPDGIRVVGEGESDSILTADVARPEDVVVGDGEERLEGVGVEVP